MQSNRALRHLIFATVLFASALSARAYDLIRFSDGSTGSLNPGSTTMLIRMHAFGTLQDGTTYATSVRQAMLDWNAQLGRMQFLPVIEPSGEGEDGNTTVEVFFSYTIYGDTFDSGTLAVTLTSAYSVRDDDTLVLGGSDVIFNSTYNWNSYRGPLNSLEDIRRVAIHEFGHVLGLDHPDQAIPVQSKVAIMNSTVSSIDSLQADDIAGGRSLYGAPGSVTPPANDLFANATAITLTSATQTFSGSNVHAFKQDSEPFHASGESGGSSVWWKWTAPVSGSLKVTTRNSSFDTMLAAYSGATLASLTQLAYNDDEQAPSDDIPEETRIRTSIVTISVNAGTTYHFAVDGWAAEQGSVLLNLELTSAPVITSSPANRTINGGANTTFTVAAFGSGTVSYQWRKGGGNISGATSASYTINGATGSDAGTYDCVVSNNLGNTTSAAATLTVNQASQTITFTAPAQLTYGSAAFTLNASASSGLPVTFFVVSGPGQLSGAQLTATNVGTVRVRASQAGNGAFAAAADVLRDITIAAAPATVHLANLTATYDGSPKSATVTTSPADLSTSVTYNGSATAPTNAGAYPLSATITDARYQGSINSTFTIAKATQTITFGPLSDVAFTTTPLSLSATATSGLPVVFSIVDGLAEVSGTSLWLTGTGTVTVRAMQPGDANREAAAPIDRSFTVSGNFAAWQYAHFTEDELTFANISGPNADPDGDGYANLLEYALGTAPKSATQPVNTMTVSATATEWMFVYFRPIDRSDVTYVVEVSGDLLNWSSANVTQELEATVGAEQTWRVTVPMSGTAPVFFRLRVELP